MNESWYYADVRNQQQGPVDAAGLRAAHARGEVSDATLVWHAGLAGWEPLARHAEALGLVQRLSMTAGAPMAAAARTAPRAPRTRGSSGWVVAIAVLFIGIMVVGVIAALAMPAYGDYTTRARFAEARSQAQMLEYQVEEQRAATGKCPANDEAGIGSADAYAGELVATIEVGTREGGSECSIRVVFKSFAGAEAGRELLLVRGEDGSWRESSNLPNRVLPDELRH